MMLNRRGLLGAASALVLGAFLSVSGLSAASALEVNAGCACCGDDCVCTDCTCDAAAKAGQACDCCGESACCSTSKGGDAATHSAKSGSTGENTRTAQAKSTCDCCGADCACESCRCDAQAGQACDCCKGAACCTSTVSSKPAKSLGGR